MIQLVHNQENNKIVENQPGLTENQQMMAMMQTIINQNIALNQRISVLEQEVHLLREENRKLKSSSNTCKKIAIGVGLGIGVVFVGSVVAIVAVKNPELIDPMVKGISNYLEN